MQNNLFIKGTQACRLSSKTSSPVTKSIHPGVLTYLSIISMGRAAQLRRYNYVSDCIAFRVGYVLYIDFSPRPFQATYPSLPPTELYAYWSSRRPWPTTKNDQ